MGNITKWKYAHRVMLKIDVGLKRKSTVEDETQSLNLRRGGNRVVINNKGDTIRWG